MNSATNSLSNSVKSLEEKCHTWKPFSCISGACDEKIALIKLNTPFGVDGDVALYRLLWDKAVIRACADGGANVLFNHPEFQRDKFIPTFISGDFDSAEPEILQFYKNQGVEIIPTPDQDETDFTKCLRLVHEKINSGSSEDVSKIVVHVSQEGRLDHVFANFNTLYKNSNMGRTPVYLIHEQSISFLLPPGKNLIDVDSPLRGSWCSLVPIGCPADHVTISGLKYCVDDERLSMDSLISTSNAFTDTHTQISVVTDQPLLFSMALSLSSFSRG